jgi:two-component system LytT family sensor kinase
MEAILKPLKASPTDGWIKSRLIPLWVGLGIWIGLVMLFAFTSAIFTSQPWIVSVKNAGLFWALWIFYLPFIIWLSLRFPLERSKMFWQISIHLVACVLIVTISQIIYQMVLPPPPARMEIRGGDLQNSLPPIGPGMRVMPDILIYLLIMSGCVAYAHFRMSQERERRAIELEARLAQARLHALRMQINPHFLFNTLNAISTLVHTDPHTADDMITDLSKLFRASLENSDEDEISLFSELELLQCYLSIEQRRFGERLQVEKNIAPDVVQALVPTLILQPIVENAIRHGIEPNAAAGKIIISAGRDGDKIKLSVRDNGKKQIDLLVPNRRRGIGLTNSKERLQQLYGGEQSLVISENELGGWTVEIKIPFRPAKQTS